MPMPWIIFLSLSLHALKMHSEIMWHLKSFFLRCCVHKSILTMFTCISMSASFSYLNLHVALYRDILCKVQIWKCKLCSMQVSQEKLVWRLELIWSETKKQRVRQRRKMESEFRGKESCIEYQLYNHKIKLLCLLRLSKSAIQNWIQ